jgi:hypothetical protein
LSAQACWNRLEAPIRRAMEQWHNKSRGQAYVFALSMYRSEATKRY